MPIFQTISKNIKGEYIIQVIYEVGLSLMLKLGTDNTKKIKLLTYTLWI